MANIQLGRLLINQRKWRQAEQVYLLLLETDPTNSHLALQLSRCRAAMNRLDEAISTMEQALVHNPENILILLELSGLYYSNDQLQEGLALVNRALERYPNSIELWKRKGQITFKQTNHTQAAVSYGKAVELGDTTARVLRNLGMSFYLSNAPNRAEDAFQRALQKDGSDANTLFYLGMIAKDRGFQRASLQFFEETTALLTSDLLLYAYAQKADTHGNMNDPARATNLYKRILDMNPESSSTYFHLAAIYDQHYDDRETPLRYYRKFLDSNSEDNYLRTYATARVQSLTSQIHFESGRSDD